MEGSKEFLSKSQVVSTWLLGSFKVVSRVFHLSFKGFSRFFNCVSRKFQGPYSFEGVSRGILRMFQGYFMEV